MKTKEELLARLTEVKASITTLNTTYEGQYIDPDSTDGKSWNELNAEHDQLKRTIAQIEARESRLAELAGDPEAEKPGAGFLTRRPGAITGNDIYDLSTIRATLADPQAARAEMHDRAKRAIEVAKFPHADANREDTQAHLERLLETVNDPTASFSRRILATGSPRYKDSFARWISSGGTNFSADMTLGTDGEGGFAVPFELDPTIMLTSNGAVNPYRSMSNVVKITGKEWDGVTSAGITASRADEAAEVADQSPGLGGPSIKTTRVHTFVEASYELELSWGGMAGELAVLIQDAKDTEEATAFTTGNGTAPNPSGLLTGATVSINTAGTATFASVDLDSAEQALPARFQPRAQWVANRKIYNLIRHFDSAGGPNYWVNIADGLDHGGNTGRTLLNYPANECSAFGTATTSASKLLVLGDFRYFKIVDRIGLSIRYVPMMFGTTANLPTGQSGFYAYWFNNCKVLVPSAFVTLKAL